MMPSIGKPGIGTRGGGGDIDVLTTTEVVVLVDVATEVVVDVTVGTVVVEPTVLVDVSVEVVVLVVVTRIVVPVRVADVIAPSLRITPDSPTVQPSDELTIQMSNRSRARVVGTGRTVVHVKPSQKFRLLPTPTPGRQAASLHPIAQPWAPPDSIAMANRGFPTNGPGTVVQVVPSQWITAPPAAVRPAAQPLFLSRNESASSLVIPAGTAKGDHVSPFQRISTGPPATETPAAQPSVLSERTKRSSTSMFVPPGMPHVGGPLQIDPQSVPSHLMMLPPVPPA